MSSIRWSFFSSSFIMPNDVALREQLVLRCFKEKIIHLHKLLSVLDLQHPLLHTAPHNESLDNHFILLP